MNSAVLTGHVTPEMHKGLCSRFAKGVTVVTTRGLDARPVGMTVSAFTSVSLEPPTVLICLRSASRIAPAFLGARHFCVNVLSEGQREVSQQFARRDVEDRFHGVCWNEGPYRLPLIPDALGHLICERGEIVINGDHDVIFGHVVAGSYNDAGYPLVHWASDYRCLSTAEPYLRIP